RRCRRSWIERNSLRRGTKRAWERATFRLSGWWTVERLAPAWHDGREAGQRIAVLTTTPVGLLPFDIGEAIGSAPWNARHMLDVCSRVDSHESSERRLDRRQSPHAPPGGHRSDPRDDQPG